MNLAGTCTATYRSLVFIESLLYLLFKKIATLFSIHVWDLVFMYICVCVFRFEGDCVSHWDRRICSRGSTNYACSPAYHGVEAEAECNCACLIPQFLSHSRIWVAWPVVLVSSQGNFGCIVSLGPFVIHVLSKLCSFMEWNFFLEWISEYKGIAYWHNETHGIFWYSNIRNWK